MNLLPTRPSDLTHRSAMWSGVARLFCAGFATLLLVGFLVLSRWSFNRVESLKIRAVSSVDDSVSQPAPPPPPPMSTIQPPPPPPEPVAPSDLPQLDLAINESAPPIRALIESRALDLSVKPANFSPSVEVAKPANLFASFELDDQPRLINRPSVSFPASLKNQGIKEGRVVLEVLISRTGEVTVREVISSSHPDFVPMAKSFATRARFSPPKKDGRVVNAVFNWPLVLKP